MFCWCRTATIIIHNQHLPTPTPNAPCRRCHLHSEKLKIPSPCHASSGSEISHRERMSPSSYPLVNSVIASLPSSSAAAAAAANHHLITFTSSYSSASMGWTLRQSFASSIVALLSARASSSQSQQTASSRIMTTPTSTATAADVSHSDFYFN